MKEKENTSPSNSKRLIYSIILAICVLLLVAATVLTVYFVTGSNNEILDTPPNVENPDDPGDPSQPENPDDPGDPSQPENPDDPGKEDPGKPSGGEGRVAFIAPLAYETCSVEFNVVYNNTSTDKWYYHKAIDFAADAGTDVVAMGDGYVLSISTSSTLGNLVILQHADGIQTVYRFVEPVSGLREGDQVKQGDVIAKVADAYGTEYKDGAHLHLEMLVNGSAVDPTDYINATLDQK